MLDRSTRIKNLSIALEALSRINSTTINYEVEKVLRFELEKYQEEQEQTQTERQKPTSTSTDDEIPF